MLGKLSQVICFGRAANRRDHCSSLTLLDWNWVCLKTLFNTVETGFKTLLNLRCLCCIMMFSWINSQEWKSFEIDAVTSKISMTEYHHWINRQTYGLFLHSSLLGYGGKEYGIKSGHLCIFTSLKHLVILLKCSLFRASFLHLIKDTDSMNGHAAQIFKSRNIVKQCPIHLGIPQMLLSFI